MLAAGLIVAFGVIDLVADLGNNWIAARREAPPPEDWLPRARPPEQPRRIPARDPALADAAPRGKPGRFFGPDQYPRDAIAANEQGCVVAALRLDATGTPRGCTVRVSSGSRSLDAATCTIALRDITFSPARDHGGSAIESTYVLPVRWVLPDA